VKNGTKFLQVIENTYRKNVHFSPLQDVDENIDTYSLWRFRQELGGAHLRTVF
jgi:hypothetical protein